MLRFYGILSVINRRLSEREDEYNGPEAYSERIRMYPGFQRKGDIELSLGNPSTRCVMGEKGRG